MKSRTFEIRRTADGRRWTVAAAFLAFCLAFLGQPAWAKNPPTANRLPSAVCRPPSATQPDVAEFTKTISREFSTTADGTTALYNKYGKVNVKTWQNTSVKIDVTIVVNAKNQSEADKLFNRINVNFANSTGYVKAETVIAEQSKGSWGWGDWNWSGNSCGDDFKINYEVWMPVGNQLDLKNKYGDSYVANLNGKLLAEIKYGDIRTEAINNDCDLSLGYGKANISRVNNLNGQISYGELNLTESRDIQLDTKYSDLSFERANNVRLVSKYDDIDLGSVADLRLQTKYSDLSATNARAAFVTAQYTNVEIKNLTETIDADMAYGELKIESLNRNFQGATLNGKYTDFSLAVERGANFRFEAEGSYTDLKYPYSATIKRKDENGSWEAVKGYIGDENARGLVKAKLSYGAFVLK
ncbi:MAG: hypothetical protein ACK4Q5_03010 [Saprospiraceae bacterium]